MAHEEKIHIYLDATRLVSRQSALTPTGIDRVDLRYAIFFLLSERYNIILIVCRNGKLEFLSAFESIRLVTTLAARWFDGMNLKLGASDLPEIEALSLKKNHSAGAKQSRDILGKSFYVNCTHQNLEDDLYLKEINNTLASNFIIFIHDLIPINFPEYVRLGEPEKQIARLETVARYRPNFVVNSEHTARDLRKFFEDRTTYKVDRLQVLHIGVESFGKSSSSCPAEIEVPQEPFFLMVGTIEPRKNHLGMLWIWRKMICNLAPEEVPKLVIVGKRGWMNDAVFSMLDRNEKIIEFVEEKGTTSDVELDAYIRNANALLMPAFTEGWGMPVVEALNAGTPVIASRIPALQEAGQGVPTYLDPTDLNAWMKSILEYAKPRSRARKRQIKRIGRYCAPSWARHFSFVEELLINLSQK